MLRLQCAIYDKDKKHLYRKTNNYCGRFYIFDQTTIGMDAGISIKKDSKHITTEILAGVSSFLATAYIIVVNPSILSQAGMPFPAVLTATILVSFSAV